MWYLEPALGVVLGVFFIGILFQIIYYKFFHPNNYPPYSETKSIKLWIPLKQLCKMRAHSKNPSNKALGSPKGQARMLELSKYHSHHSHSDEQASALV
jgi:hypothetical protein